MFTIAKTSAVRTSSLRSFSTFYFLRASKPSTATTKSSDSSEKTPPRPQHDTAATVAEGLNTLPGSGSSNPSDRVPGETNVEGKKASTQEKGVGNQESDVKEKVKGPLADAKSPKK